jgi:hypothetical protein
MTTPFKEARRIREWERDFELDLDSKCWPLQTAALKGWERGRGYFYREIVETDEEKKAEEQLAGPIKESVLRFPSAPIHGLHRLHEYQVNRGHSETFHTYRVLTHPKEFTRVRRIFLMHNGLNETQSQDLYYRLASHLISQDPGGTACLLRPFPAHLTRSGFQQFAETPLDHYLWDGSNLFRQFFRYMIETQWLLSVIARRSSYRCISGLNLLAESEFQAKSRLEDSVLSTAMSEAWEGLYGASGTAIESLHEDQRNATSLASPPPEGSFLDAISALRGLLQLDSKLGGDFESHRREEPTVHVVGYSLGGFTAQSVFMAWPFLVSSCSTLLSGGALRELAPTAFADPEEWQTVLHSLRYELDDAMMSGRYSPEGEHVLGIKLDLFLFLKRTFYEVFQQEYRGSFQTRLSAFRRRMLFVVGGNDPIVRPKSVLDSGPPDGINLVSIGGLGHFLGARARDQEEREQRLFWVPEIARLIAGLAGDAATKQHEERAETWLDQDMELPVSELSAGRAKPLTSTGRLSVSERLEVDADGALPATLFQRCLDDLLARPAAGDGLLFVLRNELPSVLLDENSVQQRAAALNHTDAGMAKYIRGVRARRDLIFENIDRIRIVLPWNVQAALKGLDARAGHPSQSESAGGEVPHLVSPEEAWGLFRNEYVDLVDGSRRELIRVFDGRTGFARGGLPKLKVAPLAAAARKRLRTKGESRPVTPSLPDCWIWMSHQFLHPTDHERSPHRSVGDRLSADSGRRQLCSVVPQFYLKDPARLGEQLRREQLRIVTVSRARYNPRFRGRIIADPDAAKDLLLHVTLCIAGSVPLHSYEGLRHIADGDPETSGI